MLRRMLNSPTLNKARRVLAKQGPVALLSGSAQHVVDAVRATAYLRRKPRFGSLDAMLDEPVPHGGRIFKAMQVRSEITGLLELVRDLRPRRILEIGTANGGTVFLWTRVAAPDATIVSVDLPGGQWGDGYALWRVPIYQQFPVDQQRLHLLRANSHAHSTLEQVQAILTEPLDFLFIDGDHSYAGVKQDFEMYAPLVRKGGLIALHDIAKHPAHLECHVDLFWAELKEQYGGTELIGDPKQGWAGIGVIRR